MYFWIVLSIWEFNASATEGISKAWISNITAKKRYSHLRFGTFSRIPEGICTMASKFIGRTVFGIQFGKQKFTFLINCHCNAYYYSFIPDNSSASQVVLISQRRYRSFQFFDCTCTVGSWRNYGTTPNLWKPYLIILDGKNLGRKRPDGWGLAEFFGLGLLCHAVKKMT